MTSISQYFHSLIAYLNPTYISEEPQTEAPIQRNTTHIGVPYSLTQKGNFSIVLPIKCKVFSQMTVTRQNRGKQTAINSEKPGLCKLTEGFT